MARKTKLMRRVEQQQGGEELETLLPRLLNENGQNLTETAERLGVSAPTLSYWLIKLRIEMRTIALAPGKTFQIIDN